MKKSSVEYQRKMALKCLRNLKEQNTSATETIRSININPNGIVFTFRKGLSLNVNWCLNEVIMLTRMAKMKVKKNQIGFWQKGHQLLLPYYVLNTFNSHKMTEICAG